MAIHRRSEMLMLMQKQSKIAMGCVACDVHEHLPLQGNLAGEPCEKHKRSFGISNAFKPGKGQQ